MRLLYLADPFLPVPPPLYGGVERVVEMMANQAVAAGHEVALMAHPDSSLPGVKIYPLAGAPEPHGPDLLLNMARVRAAVRDFQPDLLHSFARLIYLLPILRSSLPKVMSFQRQPTARTVGWSARLAGKSLSFTGCSDYISTLGRSCGGQWETIYNPVPLSTYTFQPKVADDAPLVFLSRMNRIKGAHRAIAIAKKTGRTLILAGNHETSGPEGDYWRHEISPLIDGKQIRYIGPVNDVQKNNLLGQAAALLVPIEWNEPFGIVFIEALACGTPVLSCPRGALPEIVTSGQHGFLLEDTDALADAVAKISSLDRAACRARVETLFSTEQVFSGYAALYRQRCSLNGLKVKTRL